MSDILDFIEFETYLGKPLDINEFVESVLNSDDVSDVAFSATTVKELDDTSFDTATENLKTACYEASVAFLKDYDLIDKGISLPSGSALIKRATANALRHMTGIEVLVMLKQVAIRLTSCSEHHIKNDIIKSYLNHEFSNIPLENKLLEILEAFPEHDIRKLISEDMLHTLVILAQKY